MLTKKDSTIVKNDADEQSSSLPNSSSFMMLFSHRKRSSSHPLSRTTSLEGGIVVGDDLKNSEDAVAGTARGFVPGLDFNQKEYDEKDAGAPIPSTELTSPRLFTPRHKPLSRAASTEAGITIADCPSNESRTAVASM
jgi:hypothetical protein